MGTYLVTALVLAGMLVAILGAIPATADSSMEPVQVIGRAENMTTNTWVPQE